MLEEAFLVFANVQVNQNVVRCLSLVKPVPTNQFTSNSVLLSLAAHVTFRFPFLDLAQKSSNLPKIKPESRQVNEFLTNHPLQEFWCDMFAQAIIKNQAIVKDKTLYMVLDLSESQFAAVMKYKQKMREFSTNYEKDWIDSILKQISGFEQLPRKNKKIAYMNVSGSQLRQDLYAPIINVRALILGQIYNNENWKSYNILKGEAPTLEQFQELDGVVIPGSTNSVLSNIREVQEMSKNLFAAFQTNKKLKIFGICYGHQLIAHKNNGFVVKKARTDKVETYKFNEALISELKNQFSFLQNLADKQAKTLLLQHHEDYVETVLEDFYVLASSQTSQVQCLLHKSGRMLSFQSHPEYFYEYTQGYLQRLMNYKTSDRGFSYINKKDEHQMKIHHNSSERIRQVMSQFLNWECVNNK